jgi:hypothetical protein
MEDRSHGHMRDLNFEHRHIQSVLFPLKFNITAVARWLKLKGFKYDNIKVEKKYIHARQFDPIKGSKNRIFKLPDSQIRYVLEYDE